MFTGYHIDGLCFDPPNLKNLAFQGIKGEKVILLRILIIGSPIQILFLLKTFYRRVGGASQVSWLSDLRFEF